MILTKTGKVRAAECDSNSQLSAIGVFQRVEEMVTDLFGEHGIDSISVRENYGCMWVYVRNKILFGTPVGWNKELHLCCRVSGVKAYGVVVHTSIQDAENRMVAESFLEICLLNIASQALTRLDTVGLTKEAEEPAPETADSAFVRCRERDFASVGTRRVCATNIDMSHHTNNIAYVRFILDALTASRIASENLREIQMEYLSQSFEGETLCLERSQGNPDFWRMTREGKPVTACHLVFKDL